MDHAFEIISGLCGLIITILSASLIRLIATYDKEIARARKEIEKTREELEQVKLDMHEADTRLTVIESKRNH